MLLSPFPKPWLLAVCSIILVAGCKKGNSSGGTPSNLPPAITPVGTPVGTPSTKNIGPAGGIITSADGRVELNFPAGALGSNTTIGIQPVTGESPGGIGLGYHFMPDGAVFGTPVTLTFHFADSDASGTIPYLFYIAWQDSAGRWNADIKTRTVDTVSRTVSLGISHFSIWEMGDRLHIELDPANDQVRENDTRHLSVEISGDNVVNSSDPEIYLPVMTKLADGAVKAWKIASNSGSGQDGTISGSGNTAIYTAPSLIVVERPEQLEADLNYSLTYFNNGQAFSVNKIILFKQITLIPDAYTFDIKIEASLTGTAGMTLNGVVDQYSDGATFQVEVNGSTVKVSNIANQVPIVIPSSGVGPDGQTQAIWQKDSLGIVNIVGITGDVIPVGTIPIVNLTISHQGTKSPKWSYTSGGISYTMGGDAQPGYPGELSFILKDSAQTQTFAGGNITVTPN